RLAAAVGNPLTATDSQVATYADRYYEYDSQGRVTTAVAPGEGCSTRARGPGTLTHSLTPPPHPPRHNTPASPHGRTPPDGNQNIVYTNAYGQIMLKALKDTTSNTLWPEFFAYDSSGRLVLQAEPSAVTGFDDTYADLLHNVSGNYQYLADSAGLVYSATYYASTTATSSTAGGVAGYLDELSLQPGQTGTPVPP